MEFKSIMHVAFYTDQMDEMIDFYTNKLGGKLKVVTKAKAYLGMSGVFAKIAETDPDQVIIVYIEIAPLQFIELFPKATGQSEHPSWNESIGYSHFSLLVDDLQLVREELVSKGVKILTEPSIGNSNTWKMWIADPDDNRIEIMQFTENSFQITGHIDE